MNTSPLRFRFALACLAVVLALAPACGGGSGGGDEDDGNALTIAAGLLPGGVVGSFYSTTLLATGGSGSGHTWEIAAGALPDGVGGIPVAGPTARLSGIPGTAGDFPFTLRLRDGLGAEVSGTYRITITPAGGPGTSFPTSPVNAPVGRSGHSAVWIGTEMIVWGGLTMVAPLADGSAYNPASDTWRTISTVGAPAPRWNHTAVWTGAEMIVFGGWDGNGPLGTGGAYDPVQDTWRPLNLLGAPQARVLHSAVWTGTAMIVWGGLGVFPPPRPNSVALVFLDGFAYTPLTDAWAPIANALTVARGHTGVWTGTRMITWGGRDSFALSISTVNGGGLYDPTTNAWTATPLASVPAARTYHTAVWTGAEMIVWGGTSNGLARIATGGRLPPGSNAWQPTSLVGAPVGRSGHSAVWTGTEMLIWGGADGVSGVRSDGAAYRPLTNSWRPLTSTFLPAARSGHTAVWTGGAMIVWGGQGTPADSYLASGAVIQP